MKSKGFCQPEQTENLGDWVELKEGKIKPGQTIKPRFRAFLKSFPKIAKKETRGFWLSSQKLGLPAPYELRDYYCVSRNCDCNLVLIHVLDHSTPSLPVSLFSVYFTFDQGIMDVLPEPGRDLAEIEGLFTKVSDSLMKDERYLEQLEHHYFLMKAARNIKDQVSYPEIARKVMTPFGSYWLH